MPFNDKQQEYLLNATHRWNIKTGATRSGKTWLDIVYTIPRRILKTRGEGHIFLIGNTKGTLQRNIIDPMQELWGSALVGNVSSDNTVRLFGKKAYALGAEKINQVTKIQGSGLEYCYGDEITTWNEEVFEMLKSRLSCPHSVFDGTCNPSYPTHWLKGFLDRGKLPPESEEYVDVYEQHYTIDDNPALDPAFVSALKREYAGTIYYDRFILGLWKRAEGAIYRQFADHPATFITSERPSQMGQINVGVDFGGNGSRHAFVASTIVDDKLYALRAESPVAKGTDVDHLIRAFTSFCNSIERDFGPVFAVYADSAEQTIINTLRNRTKWAILNSIKNEIHERIRCESILFGSRRLFLLSGECLPLETALQEAVWNSKTLRDERLDDGSTNIDVLDAFEYSWEAYLRQLIS